MDATTTDPLARLALALEALSANQLKLAEAAERLAASSDAVPRRRLTGAAHATRRAARETAAAAARVSDVQLPAPGS
jgi:hypothetical protein